VQGVLLGILVVSVLIAERPGQDDDGAPVAKRRGGGSRMRSCGTIATGGAWWSTKEVWFEKGRKATRKVRRRAKKMMSWGDRRKLMMRQDEEGRMNRAEAQDGEVDGKKRVKVRKRWTRGADYEKVVTEGSGDGVSALGVNGLVSRSLSWMSGGGTWRKERRVVVGGTPMKKIAKNVITMVVFAACWQQCEGRCMIPLMRWTWFVSRRNDVEAIFLASMAAKMTMGVLEKIGSGERAMNECETVWKNKRRRGYRELCACIEWASKAQEVIHAMITDKGG